MIKKITDPDKDPLGCMMIDYIKGDPAVFVQVDSTNLDMWQMTGKTMFRTYSTMDEIEHRALRLCRGRILDAGAGSGCHSLWLQAQGHLVDALDVSCGSVRVMREQKVRHIIHDSFFCLKNRQYDTILMLMNGIGITGSLDGLNLFFQSLSDILAPGGRVITDSTDLAGLYPENALIQAQGDYYGQTEFTMRYNTIKSDPFDWLYIDFDTLSWFAAGHGFACRKILSGNSGKYLAVITRRSQP